MKSVDKINKLANKFALKLLLKYAAVEQDSTGVTLAVRPTVNNMLTKNNFNANLQKVLQDVVAKIAEANQQIHGTLKIDIFVVNAAGTPGKWKINTAKSGLKVSGSLLNDKIAGPTLKTFISKMNALIFPVLEKEFNRLSAIDKEGWAGNVITNHESDISEVNISI